MKEQNTFKNKRFDKNLSTFYDLVYLLSFNLPYLSIPVIKLIIHLHNK